MTDVTIVVGISIKTSAINETVILITGARTVEDGDMDFSIAGKGWPKNEVIILGTSNIRAKMTEIRLVTVIVPEESEFNFNPCS